MGFLDQLEGEGIQYFQATEWIEHLGYKDDLHKGRAINQKFIESDKSMAFKVTDDERRQWAWVFTESFLSTNAVGLGSREQLCTMTEVHYKKTKESLKKYVRR